MHRLGLVSICLAAALATGCSSTSSDDPTQRGSGGAGGAGGTGGVADDGPPDGWDAQVSLNELPDLNDDPNIVEVELEAKVAEVEYKAGIATAVWTYNGSVPGPLIRAKLGDTLLVRFTNSLPEETTIHWHGVRVPAEMDGAGPMSAPIAAGASFEYRFELKDAGTFWYHPHVRSDEQVEKGLYGAIIVEDAERPVLGDELTLVLDDVNLRADGTLAPPGSGGHTEQMIGRQGNTLLVNGKVQPTIGARAGRRQHWRLINAANSRYFNLAIPGYVITRVGGDGGLLPQPIETQSLLLVPGERAEIVLTPTGTPADRIAVQNLPYERGHNTGAGGPAELFALEIADLSEIESSALPETLGTVEELDTEGLSTAQTVEFNEAMNGMDMVFLINGKAWPDTEPLQARVGETQVWEVTNASGMDHPFHLHGFFFQVLSVDGETPAALEWKDTVNLPANATVRFAVSYDDRPGSWMFHCHILEHAELGMMAELEVAP